MLYFKNTSFEEMKLVFISLMRAQNCSLQHLGLFELYPRDVLYFLAES